MKIKRRWKVMIVLPMLWLLIGLTLGIPLYEHGYEAWSEHYYDASLIMGGWFLGTILGVLLFSGAIDAEERENADSTFKNNVYGFYIGMLSVKSAEDSVNETAIQYDISPSGVRGIVKIYENE